MVMRIWQRGEVVGEIHTWFEWLRFVYRSRRAA